MNITLYELSNEVRDALDNAFDPDTGEALPAFEECRAMWSNKAQHVAAYLLNREANAAMLKLAIGKMEARMKAEENRANRLRAYLLDNMAAIGATKITANDGTFEVVRYPERDESVEIDPCATFPAELCGEPKPPAPSKTKIKDAIKAGRDVAGARIVRKDRLTIK